MGGIPRTAGGGRLGVKGHQVEEFGWQASLTNRWIEGTFIWRRMPLLPMYPQQGHELLVGPCVPVR
jgi:hypothetical protein